MNGSSTSFIKYTTNATWDPLAKQIKHTRNATKTWARNAENNNETMKDKRPSIIHKNKDFNL